MPTVPSDDELRSMIRSANRRALGGRLKRLRFLLEHSDEEPFLGNVLAHEYAEEARLCWFHGAFVAAIIMCQLALEELPRGHYRVVKGVEGELEDGKKVDQATFADLIREASQDSRLRGDEPRQLHRLRREVRNPYVHSKDVGLDKSRHPHRNQEVQRDFFMQSARIRATQIMSPNVEDDAREVLELMLTLLPRVSRRFWGER